LEQKSEQQVQTIVTSILVNLMQKGESLKIETNSFLMQYFVIESSSLESTTQNNYIQLPSFCDLTQSINNCSHNFINCSFDVSLRLQSLQINLPFHRRRNFLAN
jgi:hypothetical protein